MAGGIDNNMRNFNAPDMGFADRATALAQLAYGHGIREGKSGGTGNMGIVGGKVIKFNTKSKERSKTDKLDKNSLEYRDMKESCDNLRQELRKMAYEVKEQLGDDFNTILGELGFESEENMTEEEAREQKGVIKGDVGLYTRKDAASLLKKLAAAYEQKEEMATGELVDAMWNGHKPSWGNSVEVFNNEVDKHVDEVYSVLKQDFSSLVDETVGGKDAAATVIARKFPEYSKKISGWLDRTAAFLKGLVPQNSKNASSLTSLSVAINAGCEAIRKILGEMELVCVHDTKLQAEVEELKTEVDTKRQELKDKKDNARQKYVTFFEKKLLPVLSPDDDKLKGLPAPDVFKERIKEARKLVEENPDGVLTGSAKKEILEWMTIPNDDEAPKDESLLGELYTAKITCLEEKVSLEKDRPRARQKDVENFRESVTKLFAEGKGVAESGTVVWKQGPVERSLTKDYGDEYRTVENSKAYKDMSKKENQRMLGNPGKSDQLKYLKNVRHCYGFDGYSDAMKEGFGLIGNEFEKIFTNINGIHFSDGVHRGFFRIGDGKINISEKDVPKEMRDIKPALQKVIGTFNHIVGSFEGLDERVDTEIAKKKEAHEWYNKFTKKIGDLSKKFDEICGGPEDRKTYLKNMADNYSNKDFSTLQTIAEYLLDMGKTAFYPGFEGDDFDVAGTWNGDIAKHYGEGHGARLYGGLFVFERMPVSCMRMFKSEPLAVYWEATEFGKDVKDIQSFKAFIKDLVKVAHSRSSEKSIFSKARYCHERYGLQGEYENDCDPCIPQQLLLTTVSSIKKAPEKTETLNTTLEFYRRLREVAVAFKIIDDETGNFI